MSFQKQTADERPQGRPAAILERNCGKCDSTRLASGLRKPYIKRAGCYGFTVASFPIVPRPVELHQNLHERWKFEIRINTKGFHVTNRTDRVELLAPAGSLEKLEIAVHYGADAVYLGGKDFSLRQYAGNFSHDEMAAAIDLAHEHDVRVYVACNIFTRSDDAASLERYLHRLRELSPDGIIVADPSVLLAARRLAPTIPVHMSTQANTTNPETARFWKTMGAARVNAARELSLSEVREMAENSGVAVEVFAHGAMCMAYSGRCLLSSFLAGRDGNRGLCAQACRWRYALVEAKRPGQFMPVAEDAHGTYIFNARDLSMIRHIPELIETGVAALKIEGRMKGINYLASVVKTYREAIDAYYRSPEAYRIEPHWIEELDGVSRRGTCTGFYFGSPEASLSDGWSVDRTEERLLVGKVLERMAENRCRIDVRNPFSRGERLQGISPSGLPRPAVVMDIRDADGIPMDRAVPGATVTASLDSDWHRFDLLRKTVPAPNSKTSNR